jgi:hypothetical protein
MTVNAREKQEICEIVTMLKDHRFTEKELDRMGDLICDLIDDTNCPMVELVQALKNSP